MTEQSAIDNAVSSHLDQRLAARELELNQLAAELSRQSQRLNDRDAEIAEREAELNRRQKQFTIENEGVATAAQSRRHLAEEFSRQQTLWQEWNSAYRQSTAHLKSQLETIEQRRAGILVETARLESKRSEIQRIQAECDNERRALAGERAAAAKELAELHSQRAAFEAECQQKTAELLAAQQQSEFEQKPLVAERSLESIRAELDQAALMKRIGEVTASDHTMVETQVSVAEVDEVLSDQSLADTVDQIPRFETETMVFSPIPVSELVRSSQPSAVQTAIESQPSAIAFTELPEGLRLVVVEHCQKGERLMQIAQQEEALDQFAAAWELLPDPKNQWQTATSILIAAIDIFFQKGDFIAAREILREFVDSCDTEINPLVLWRFGQSLFETGDFDAAYDVLETASRLSGPELLANEDPKYLEFVKTQMIAMTPVRSENSNSLVNPPHRLPSADLLEVPQ